MRPVALAALLAACGGGRTDAPDTQAVGDSAPAGPVMAPPDTTYPAARRGALTTRAARPSVITEWRATAGRCTDPPSFQVLALGDSVDLIMVLHPPAGGWAPGAFTVTAPEDTTDRPGTARLAAQRVGYVDQAYQGEGGAVELSRIDHLASGRLNVVFREVESLDTVRYRGVFDRLRVDSLAAGECLPMSRGLPPGVH